MWKPYHPRNIVAAGILELAGWRLKRYEITFDGAPLDSAPYAEGVAQAARLLPQPPSAANRAGLGFVIFHSGATHHYLVLCWWDTQNELFTRVVVRPRERDEWDISGRHYSCCVWDLDVMWFERNAWIESMLGPGGADTAKYLKSVRPSGPAQ